MPGPIYVINPNSLTHVTEGIAQTLAAADMPRAVGFSCVTLTAAPPGIVSQRDADKAAVLVSDFVEAHSAEASGFVIACYSDPGLYAAREVTTKPVVGIGQAALAHASTLGGRIGVIAVSSRGIARHWRSYRMFGCAENIAGERAIDLTVAQSGDETVALECLITTATNLRDEDHADVIVLGCAGMTRLRRQVEEAVGLPVVDPCIAGMAVVKQLVSKS